MAGRTYDSNITNYNYSKENVYTVANQEKMWFNHYAGQEAKSYIRLVISEERTNYNRVGKTVYTTRVNPTKPRKITIDDARLVILGGPFQEIGGKDEAVGGGSQKMGSKNK